MIYLLASQRLCGRAALDAEPAIRSSATDWDSTVCAPDSLNTVSMDGVPRLAYKLSDSDSRSIMCLFGGKRDFFNDTDNPGY